MLRNIWVETTLFAPGDDVIETRKDLMFFLEALTQRNQGYLKARPHTPRLYKSGVRYEIPKQLLEAMSEKEGNTPNQAQKGQ